MTLGLTASVDYVNSEADITVNYDSKNRILADTSTVTDAVVLTIQPNFADTVTASDSITNSVQLNLTTDTVTSSDVLSRSVTYAREYVDTVTAADVLTIYRPNPRVMNGSAMNSTAMN